MKILQADNQTLFRDGVRYILEQLSTDVCATLESGDFASTLEQMRKNQDLDLVLLDPRMPGMHGADGLIQLAKQFPGIPIVVLSASENPADIESALDAGAVGYVPKSSPGVVLLAALNLVLAGGIYTPRNPGRPLVASGCRIDLPARPTTRQQQILSFMAEGMSNKAIARQLFLAESTIKGHVRGLLQILDVRNRVQAINRARELGYL